MVKLDLTVEAMDSLMLSLIYEGYENSYWSYSYNKKLRPDDGLPKHWSDNALDYNITILNAYETLVEHYGGSRLTLARIRDKIDHGDMIIRGMSGATK